MHCLAIRQSVLCLLRAVFLLAWLAAAAHGETPPAVELLVRGGGNGLSWEEKGDLLLAAPAASFELRFADAVAGAEAPLVFTPALPGNFRWLSPRSGVWTPTEPPALSTTYRVSLRPGLRLADGRELEATLTRTFHTPPLEVRGYFAGPYRRQDAPTDPQVQLLANAALDPARVAAFLRFQNRAGEQVPAEVCPALGNLWFPLRGGEDAAARLTWRERFTPPAFQLRLAQSRGSTPLASADNRLVVSPARPLPPGTGWKLVAAAGLPSREPGVRLLGAVETEIGDVATLGVAGVRAINDGDGARRLRVRFSRPLAAEATAETLLARWLRVEPAPAGLKTTLCPGYDYGETAEVELAGAFVTDTDYRVTVEPGLPARGSSLELRERWTDTARFSPLPPRLRFPEFAVHQSVNGRRQFELRAVNVPEIRLRAKLFPPEAAGLALATYQREYHADNGRADFERVDLDRVPGQTIYQATLPAVPAAEGDDARTLTLRWDDILGARRAGVVLLEAEQPAATAGGGNRRAGTQALVQLTDIGLVWKRARGGDLLVYAFSLADARPADGATVRLLDADGQPLAETRTDADGVARLSTSGSAAAFLLATRGEDCHVVPFDEDHRDELALHRFHLPLDRFGRSDDEDGSPSSAVAGPPRETLLFSDRAVYQPGETLHLKAIVRDWPTGGELAAPAAGAVATLRAFDARGRRFWEKAVALGAAGSLAEDIILPKSGLGHYRVKVAYPDGGAAGPATVANGDDDDSEEDDERETPDTLRFQVQQYRPNPFEVKLAAPADGPAMSGPVGVPLTARYYMGTPLAKAKVAWELTARDTEFRPAGFANYTFNTGDLDSRLDRPNQDSVSLEGETTLGEDGTVRLTPEIKRNEAAPGPRAVDLAATVTDLDQASVTARSRFTVHASEFYLGLRRLPDVVRAGEPLPVEAVAVRAADGQPLAEPVPVRAKLSRVNWQTSRPANASGGYDYWSEPHVELLEERELATDAVHRVDAEWLPGTLSGAAAPFTAGEAGEYLLELTARDAAGREVLTAVSFNVLGKTEAAWNLRDVRRIDLVPDRAAYAAGQTATILLKTPIAGRALVTVEREGVRRAFSVAVAKETPAVTVPLEAGDAPNVFVSVLLLRGADASPRRVPEPEFRVGYCQLTVTRPESRLAVAVASAREDYQPRETVVAEVRATDFEGNPAAGAEVTLYAVDEGILSLTGYRTPDPVAAFFRRRPLSVRTGLTLPSLLPEDPDEREFGNKGYLVGDGGGNVELRGDRMRENFAACAVWQAALLTDVDGRARTSFPAPDSLSRYRLMAVVHDGAARFGNGEGAFRIRKPLMLEPALPRFGNVGDRLLLRAVLFNGAPTAGEVEVGVTLDDKATLTGEDARPTRRLALAAGESRAVDFPVEFVKTGRAEWMWRARMAGGDGVSVFQDSVRTTLNVGHPVPRRAEVLAFTVPAGGRLEDVLGRADPALLGGEDAVLEVSLTNSRLGELREGIGALLHYPYGCVEQTTSSLLPWLGLRGGAEALPELARPRGDVDEAVERGVNRLFSMQTETGGLAYWPGGKTAHPWGSAYGGLGLAMAKRAGFTVPAEPFKRLCEALSKGLREGAAPAGDQYHAHGETDRCLALLALALADRAEPAYHERLFAQRDTLGAEDRALLALAIAESHGPAEMLDALLRPTPNTADRGDFGDFSSRASVLGMRLLAWCRYRPEDPAVGTLLEALLRERRGGAWVTTQGNAWGLLAVAGYAETVERGAGGPARGEIVLAGRPAPFALAGSRSSWGGEFALPAAAADGRAPGLSVSNPGPQPLFLQVKLSARPTSGAPAATNAGFRVARRYERLGNDGRLTALAGDLKVGDRVLVSLDVEAPDAAAYVVVDDPLPATLEAVNPEFKTSTPIAAAVANADYGWWVSSFRELREDRAVFFCDRLCAGRYHLQYLARVRAAGRVAAPPTRVEEMYHPERFGLGGAETLVTSPLE